MIRAFPKPIICRVNGPVMGGGMGILFATDLRISLESANFSFPEVKRGIVPALISAYIVPQMGLFKAKQYMLTG
jgi:methylglutaconyl-CoA hydratase